MESNDLISKVRIEIGKVTDTKQIADGDITKENGYILDIIAEHLPQKTLRYITSVADQRGYDVPTTVMRVKKVFPWGALEESTLDLSTSGATGTAVVAFEHESYNFPSLWTIDLMRRRRGLPKIRHSFDPINHKLYIDPYPTAAGDKYWYMAIEKADWTLANVPTDFEYLVVIGTSWKTLEVLMLNRTQLGGITRLGDTIEYPADRLKPFIDSRKDEFFSTLDMKSKSIGS